MQSGSNPSDRRLTSSLSDVRAVSRKMVGVFTENIAPCRTLPGELLHGDVTSVTRMCLELALTVVDGGDVPAKITWLEDAAAQWAREGIPLDTIHSAVHEGFRLGTDLVHARATAADFATVKGHVRQLLDVLDVITKTMSRAYVRELRAVVAEHHTAAHTLTSALLSGHTATSSMIRECGIDVVDAYHVLAVALPPHPEEQLPGVDAKVVARRKLRRVQSALATGHRGQTLALLSVTGGTVLIPAALPDGDLDDLVTTLSRAGQIPVTAATVTTDRADIPAAAHHAHDLLDTVQRLHRRPGLYRLGDLALEYQLTRPGPGLDSLVGMLNPLDGHPELLQTLETHLGNGLDRQTTARQLHLHANTVDYRLKRVTKLTGYDPSRVSDQGLLRAALIARAHNGDTAADPSESPTRSTAHEIPPRRPTRPNHTAV
ncbi:PucR-like helix-turn-helix protein [Nocardia mexicana]|uniref:PucR-like helix-turn-helix protein n=2 Tax=Nocardia mexicana TaxID=279262 RepID=A0A370HEP2_9NOCA|nr:PucR-like helix-turn-helix protein [Nocardia mexicana]